MVHCHRRTIGQGPFYAAVSLVCFKHRYVAKAMQHYEVYDRRCPTCQKPLKNCGKNFKPPRKTNDVAWKKTEILFTKRCKKDLS